MTAGRDLLAALQERFSAALRAPLPAAAGRLSAGAVDPVLRAAVAPVGAADADARLAAYRRQYWYRLFTVLQNEYPLTTALMGAWTFNRFAEAHLLANPPPSADIAAVGNGFDAALIDRLGLPPAAPVAEAARLDAAMRAVWTAPEAAALDPGRLADALMDGAPVYLVMSPAARIVTEHRPLCTARRLLAGRPPVDEVPLDPPPAYADGAHFVLLVRAEGGVVEVPLGPPVARLYALLGQNSVEAALQALGHAFPGVDLAPLVQQAFADAGRWGLWSDMRTAPPA